MYKTILIPVENTDADQTMLRHIRKLAKLTGASLTLSSFTTGVRYSPPLKRTRLQPFGEVLVGYSHISGSLTQLQTTSSSNGFAANLGGGLDVHLNQRLSLRLIEADYLVTTFDNGINNHQNLLRVSTGIVLRF